MNFSAETSILRIDHQERLPHHGHVRVDINRQDKKILLSVTDTGPGIPASDRERVFERFYRGEDNQHIIGSGLGLSIARRIAELHNATIKFEHPDVGLKVIVEFNAAGKH